MKGRKRHILVDRLGLLLVVVVTAASVGDREGARQCLRRGGGSLKKWRKVWADGGYDGAPLRDWFLARLRIALTVVLRPQESKGFVLLARR